MTSDANEPIGGVPSPCVRNCCLDDKDICLGCYRSLSEILRWSEAKEDEKKEILTRCRLRADDEKEKQRRSRSHI
jgi:predicted Fe-S protein YdhL (DUF1289 family)